MNENEHLPKVGLREFQRDFYKHIKSAPLVLTRNKKPYLIVAPYEDATMVADANEDKPPVSHDTGTPPAGIIEKIKALFQKRIF